jgi:sugar-phosphatase
VNRFVCRAILFDLDGVLVDSAAYIEDQWRRWAAGKGLPAEPFLRVCHGRRAVETIRLAAPHLDAEAEVAAFRPDTSGNMLAIEPIEGAARLLEALPAGSWAVATSGPRTDATDRLRRAGLPSPRVLVCAEDVARGKPDPDVYVSAATALGVSPSDCIVIEDAPAGVRAARAAGMAVIALTTTHSRENLLADAWAPSLAPIKIRRVDQGRLRMAEQGLEDFRTEMTFAVQWSHAALRERATDTRPELAGMSSTLTMALIVWPRAFVSQIGDSRCYHLRAPELKQVTTDQTLARQFIDQGLMPEEAANRSPLGHVLSQAIGNGEPEVWPVLSELELQSGDMLLLCTDGLMKHVPDAQIAELLGTATSASEAASALVGAALESGGTDNVTVVAARFL